MLLVTNPHRRNRLSSHGLGTGPEQGRFLGRSTPDLPLHAALGDF